MSETDSDTNESREDKHWNESARKLLDSHGYSFQFAVQNVFNRHQRELDWWCALTEFPVSVKGTGTHIDLILQYRGTAANSLDLKILIAAECKRVDPSRSCWLFARAPYISDIGDPGTLYFDAIHKTESIVTGASYGPKEIPGVAHPGLAVYGPPHPAAYHLGLELKAVKNDQCGENVPPASRSISEATAQALRGASGLINHFADDPSLGKILVIPAIITTAKLRTTDVDLATKTDLATGKLTGEVRTKEVPWLWYNYNRSAMLRHDLKTEKLPKANLGLQEAAFWSEPDSFCRSIAVVSAAGLTDFIQARVGTLVASWVINEMRRRANESGDS